MLKTALRADDIRRLVNYDPEVGIITRKVRTSNRVHVGDTVGFLCQNGYLAANIGGLRAYVHQFAWIYVTGVWPNIDIDHADGNPLNNRISNLRLATVSQNMANKKKPSHNTSGFKGVHPKRDKWCAQIKRDGKCITLGSFDTPEKAQAAYLVAADRLFGKFARAA